MGGLGWSACFLSAGAAGDGLTFTLQMLIISQSNQKPLRVDALLQCGSH